MHLFSFPKIFFLIQERAIYLYSKIKVYCIVSFYDFSDLEDVGVEKVIQVVSSGDLTFAIKEGEEESVEYPTAVRQTLTDDGYICMSTPAFAATLVILLAILVISCLLSAFLCLRHRSFYGESSLIAAFANPVFAHKKGHF